MTRAGRGLLALLAALPLAACSARAPVEPDVVAPLDSVVTLRVGQAAEIEGTGLRVRFEGVAEDSRCPVDVTCVWEGDATVRLRVALPGSGERALELHTSLEPRSGPVGAYRVALEGLEPAPRSGESIPEGAYAAALRVSRVR